MATPENSERPWSTLGWTNASASNLEATPVGTEATATAGSAATSPPTDRRASQQAPFRRTYPSAQLEADAPARSKSRRAVVFLNSKVLTGSAVLPPVASVVIEKKSPSRLIVASSAGCLLLCARRIFVEGDAWATKAFASASAFAGL